MWPNVPNFSQYTSRTSNIPYNTGGVRDSFPRKIPSSISMYYFATETRLGSFTDIDIPELQNIPYVKMNAARLNMIV